MMAKHSDCVTNERYVRRNKLGLLGVQARGPEPQANQGRDSDESGHSNCERRD